MHLHYFQRLARLNELISNCKASQFDQETKLVSSFNNYLYEKQSAGESRKKGESWDRWMDQNGKPDLLSVQSVSAFISQAWLSDTLPLILTGPIVFITEKSALHPRQKKNLF